MIETQKVRLGIVGLGVMGSIHANTVLAGKVKRCELAAVSDIVPATRNEFPAIPFFNSAEDMIDSGLIDALLIATPHFDHTKIGVYALGCGLHVLVEKPISVHKADCQKLLNSHKSQDQVFAVMFNQRTNPSYIQLHDLITSGELGEIRRINWIVTDWFRTQAYYVASDWRATWAGEGAGVLLNQSPHQLDLWQWMFGMPIQLRAFCHRGRFHNIEVEDDVTAYMEYENGATGVFITTTGEAPGTNRLEIAAENGKIVIETNKIIWTRNTIPTSKFSRETDRGFAKPETKTIDLSVEDKGPGHVGIIINFVEAILDDVPLLAPASEGIHSVELANAMLYSGLNNKTVKLPLNAEKYECFLNGLIASSRCSVKN